MFGLGRKTRLPSSDEALPGRTQAIKPPATHFVNGHPLDDPFPQGMQIALFGMGCFWGAERRFWQLTGVYSTAVGYAGGYTPNPSYEEVCTGMTGHNEVVRVVFDPAMIDYQALLKAFWKGHDPTQGMRQGNDVGTQYRSAIYTYDESQWAAAAASRDHYQDALQQTTGAPITTEILPATAFYFAEAYHQQYLAKNPAGYCGLGGTGVVYPE
jgi:peptide-methionine (S)-S-oxide reductase